MTDKVRTWIYATRPHTLGASIAPMLIVMGALINDEVMQWGLFLLCLLIAVSAQIASNLANDYFGYINGEDTDKRVGFKRLISAHQVAPNQMLIAMMIAVTVCGLSGLLLAALRGWELLILGVLILIGVVAYSAGKYSLARIGLGDFAVVLFFGLAPILGTYYAIADKPALYLIFLALGLGIWEANILVVNNYRDFEEDLPNNKQTLIVRMNRNAGPVLYLINSLTALVFLMIGLLIDGSWIGAIVIFVVGGLLFGNGVAAVKRLNGGHLNKLLRYTNIVSIIMGLTVSVILII